MKMNKLSIFTIALGITATLVSFIAKNEQTPSALAVGKWKISDIKFAELPPLNEEQKVLFDKEMKISKDSSSLEVRANGTYHDVTWAGKKYVTDGTWKITPNGKLFITTNRATAKVDTFNIVSLTTKTMVMGTKEIEVTYTK